MTKPKLTNKQRVLRKFPRAHSLVSGFLFHCIRTRDESPYEWLVPPNQMHRTARSAWASAASHPSVKRSNKP